MSGNLFIVSAPSGAGKTTLVSEIVRRDNRIKPSISYTSRSPRPGEIDRVHYRFVSHSEFESMIRNGEFLEWAEVHGKLYGTSRQTVEEMLQSGFDVILTIDVQGAEQARNAFTDSISIFILPPSFDVLYQRLTSRGDVLNDDLDLRIHNANLELRHYPSFDFIVINDCLDVAVNELHSIIVADRCKTMQRTKIVDGILKTFNAETKSNNNAEELDNGQ